MKKSVFFRLADEELEKLEAYCESNGRSKSDVLRELIRSLKIKKKPS
jgi:predicted DNA-binding protein